MRQRDIPITRADVLGWIEDCKGEPTREYIREKLGELADEPIDTAEHDSLEDTTPLIDLIMADLPSYG